MGRCPPRDLAILPILPGSIATGSRSRHRPTLSLELFRRSQRAAARPPSQRLARHTDVDAVSESRRVADQRLEGEAIELAASQFRDARTISAEAHGDVARVSAGEQTRELTPHLLPERGNRIDARHAHAGAWCSTDRVIARVRRASKTRGALQARRGRVSEREPVAILPGSIGSIARSRGDTRPRQARATPPYRRSTALARERSLGRCAPSG